MRSIFLPCTLALFLLSGLAYTVNVSDARVDPQVDWPSTPEGWVKRFEDEVKWCAQEAYDLNRAMQGTREAIADLGGSQTLSLHYADLKRDYKEICFFYHYKLRGLQEARARIPTPTPTPTPITTAPTSDPSPKPISPSSETETKSVQPRDETNDKHIKFIKDQEQKLLELRDRKNKLIKDSNDYLKKAKSAKPKQPQPGFIVQTDSNGGLFTTTFTTPQGRILVHLPADMRAGDTISGTVIAEQNGQTDEERARNREILDRYQIKIANETLTQPWGKFKWSWLDPMPLWLKPTAEKPSPVPGGNPLTQPAGWALCPGQLMDCPQEPKLFALLGTTYGGSGQVPFTPVAGTPVPEDFLLPYVMAPQAPYIIVPGTGQGGRENKIEGPLDGDLRTTKITIGGQPVIPLAESPRSCIFKSPEQNFGLTEITVKENNVETKRPYRNIGVRLDAPTTSLHKGQSTTLTTEVSGLEGI